MKIVLNDTEINDAIISYVGSQGINISGKDIEVEFVNGRGANGNTATVDIKDPTGNTEVAKQEIEESPINTDFDEPDDDDPLM